MADRRWSDNPFIKEPKRQPILESNLCLLLLKIARESIEYYLNHQSLLIIHDLIPDPPDLGGVFVTLWQPPDLSSDSGNSCGELLRGCVGRVTTNFHLCQTVQETAVSAATKDPRFPAITLDGLKIARIEITLLSTLMAVDSLEDIEIGTHGIMIDGGIKKGLLLPKVATRMGWDRNLFFRGVCDKARLTYDCWPRQATLYKFSAFIIEEPLEDFHT